MSGARPRLGLNPRMSATDAALTCCGFGFSAAAAALPLAAFVVFAGKGELVLVVTVCAIARASSRLKLGFGADLRRSMLSRSALFLEGFSMVGERWASLPLTCAALAPFFTGGGGAAEGFGAALGAGFFVAGFLF